MEQPTRTQTNRFLHHPAFRLLDVFPEASPQKLEHLKMHWRLTLDFLSTIYPCVLSLIGFLFLNLELFTVGQRVLAIRGNSSMILKSIDKSIRRQICYSVSGYIVTEASNLSPVATGNKFEFAFPAPGCWRPSTTKDLCCCITIHAALELNCLKCCSRLTKFVVMH